MQAAGAGISVNTGWNDWHLSCAIYQRSLDAANSLPMFTGLTRILVRVTLILSEFEWRKKLNAGKLLSTMVIYDTCGCRWRESH